MRIHYLSYVFAIAAMTTAAPAFAQSSTSSGSQSASKSDATNSDMTSMQQSIKQDLTKAGFKDINIVPGEFYVHATNSSGQKVFMRIGPDSLMEFVANDPAKSSSTTGSNIQGSTKK